MAREDRRLGSVLRLGFLPLFSLFSFFFFLFGLLSTLFSSARARGLRAYPHNELRTRDANALGDQHTTCLGFKPFDSEGLICKPLAYKKIGFIPPAQGRWRIHGCHEANCTVIPDNRFYKCPRPNCSPCKDGSCIVIPGGKGPGCNVGPGGNKGPGRNKGPGGDKGPGGSDPPTKNKYTRPECPGPNCPPTGNKTMDSPLPWSPPAAKSCSPSSPCSASARWSYCKEDAFNECEYKAGFAPPRQRRAAIGGYL